MYWHIGLQKNRRSKASHNKVRGRTSVLQFLTHEGSSEHKKRGFRKETSFFRKENPIRNRYMKKKNKTL